MLHFSKKILVGISLIISYLLTILLSFYLTPPLPSISSIASAISNFQQPAKLSFNLPSLFSLPRILSSPTLTSNNNASSNQTQFQPDIDHLQSTVQPKPTNQIFPTTATSTSYPTDYPNQSAVPTTAPSLPTNTPKPSNTPKPTKAPKPTPTPPFVLTNPRPGKNIRDIAQIVGKIMCVPPAMVYAIYDNEAGYLGPKVEANWSFYNTYQGADPTDIPGSTSVFGVTQMMGDTWHKIKPYVGQKLGSTEISLNVTFDSMAAGAYHVGNISLSWKDKVGCDDWPVKYILYGACRYNGACPANTFNQPQYYNSYTYSVCESYNEYGGKQKNCH